MDTLDTTMDIMVVPTVVTAEEIMTTITIITIILRMRKDIQSIKKMKPLFPLHQNLHKLSSDPAVRQEQRLMGNIASFQKTNVAKEGREQLIRARRECGCPEISVSGHKRPSSERSIPHFANTSSWGTIIPILYVVNFLINSGPSLARSLS